MSGSFDLIMIMSKNVYGEAEEEEEVKCLRRRVYKVIKSSHGDGALASKRGLGSPHRSILSKLATG